MQIDCSLLLQLLLLDKDKFQLSLVAPLVSLDSEVEVLTTELYEVLVASASYMQSIHYIELIDAPSKYLCHLCVCMCV